MSDSKSSLDNLLRGKKIIIWGARMVGQGFSRYCSSNNLDSLCFIDSDPSLHNQTIKGLKVFSPDAVGNFVSAYRKEELLIVIAVSIKSSEIISTLKKFSLDHIKFINYSDYSDIFFTIDVVGACNLRCASCAHSIPDHGVPMNIMSFENVQKVLNKIKSDAPLCTHVALYSWGEPFLHPKLDQIIELFHQSNIAVALSTNLSHENFDKILKPLKKNPENLKVSLSGYFDKAYDNTHSGGDITLVKSNLYKLRYFIDKYKLSTHVDINYHLYRDNNGKNLEKMQNLANELNFGLSTVHALVMPLERVFNHCEGSPDSQTEDLSKNLLVTIDEGIRASSEKPLPQGVCPFRENQLNINADLTVPVCCLVFNRNHLVSNNFLDTSIQDINLNKSNSDICSKCMKLRLPEYNMGFNKEGWKEFAMQKSSTDIS